MSSIYTSPIGLTSQFAFCGLPLRLDSYRGCAFNCTFCFARFRGGNTFGSVVLPANPEQIRNKFEKALSTDDLSTNIISQFIKRRTPVHFGGMSDPFQPAEQRYGITHSILKTLAEFNYPVVISTRSDLISSKLYLDLLSQLKHVVVQFSFVSTNDITAKRFEPYSSSPSALLKTMEMLSRREIPVTCRWQPYIQGISDKADDFSKKIGSTGCRHIALEHLKLPSEKSNPLWQKLMTASGRDLYKEYLQLGAKLQTREWILPAEKKIATIIQVANEVRKQNMTFGCADNEFQYLSDTDCCCSGVDQFPGFENWFKHQISFAVRKCRNQQKITYQSIANEWAPEGSINRYLNSRTRLSPNGTVSGTIKDHILHRWNNQKSPNNPSSFFYGVLHKDEITNKGNSIYEWDFSAIKSFN